MSLVTNISTIVSTLYPDATFQLMSNLKANKESFTLESSELPFIVLDNTLVKRKQIQQNANTLTNTALRMLFLNKHSDKSNIHQTDTEMNTIVEAMEVVADNVMINILLLDQIRTASGEVPEYTITPQFRIFTSVLSGVEAVATWKENQTTRWCKTEV